MSMNITSEELLKEARALEPQLQQWRRTLHRHPEVGFDLPHTKELVKKALTEMGYEPKDCGKAGVIALAGGKKPGKTILVPNGCPAHPGLWRSAQKFPADQVARFTAICQHFKAHEDELEGRKSSLQKFSRVPQI